jgi:hypothetical protein
LLLKSSSVSDVIVRKMLEMVLHACGPSLFLRGEFGQQSSIS